MQAGDKVKVLTARFTLEESRIVDRLAKAQDMTPSQYIRAAVLTSAVLDGDGEAIRLMGKRVFERIAEYGARLMREGEFKAV